MLIAARGLTKHYDKLEVLRGVDFVLEPGELVAITGPSGAGKSTLLQLLGTLEKPDAGELKIDGVNVLALKESKLASLRNQKIGFVFQFHHLLAEFTALENICLPAYIAKRPKAEAEREAERLLEYFGLSERRDHRPSELSGGEQQRIAMARALINNPKVIFADEPTGNLDANNAEELHQLILKLRHDHNQAFVLVTHNEELAALCDRRVRMVAGLVVSN